MPGGKYRPITLLSPWRVIGLAHLKYELVMYERPIGVVWMRVQRLYLKEWDFRS